MRLAANLLCYVCIATLLTLGIGVGVMWSSGKLNRDKLFRIMAVIHDVDLLHADQAADKTGSLQNSKGQMSFEEIEQKRRIESRDLELKQQALEQGIEQLRFERLELDRDISRFDLRKKTFEERLAAMQDQTKETGYANVRQIWENMKPKQAKEHILKMIDRDEMSDVVIILSDMPIDKRRKIVQQFTAPQEVEVLDRILRMIRQGGAQQALVDEARETTAPSP